MKALQTLKLDKFCLTGNGISSSTRSLIFSEENIPYIQPKDICFNIIESTSERITQNNLTKAGVKIVQKESILIVVSGNDAGNIAILGGDAIVHKNIFYATIQNPLIKPKFLYYYLFFRRDLFVRSSGYSWRACYRYLTKLDIPFPSLKKQEIVIKQLDICLTKIYLSIVEVKKALQDIEVDKQQLFNTFFPLVSTKKSFSDFLILKVKDCGIIKAGKTPNTAIKAYYGQDYPLFKPADLTQKMQLKTSRYYLSAKGVKEAGYVRANSILFCSNGINLSKVGIARLDCACSQQMISFTSNDCLLPEFVYFQMNSDSFRRQVKIKSKNATINNSVFKDLSLEVPGLTCQRKIINDLSSGIDMIAKKEKQLKKKLHSLNNEKYNLLLRVFSTDVAD